MQNYYREIKTVLKSEKITKQNKNNQKDTKDVSFVKSFLLICLCSPQNIKETAIMTELL